MTDRDDAARPGERSDEPDDAARIERDTAGRLAGAEGATDDERLRALEELHQSLEDELERDVGPPGQARR